MSNGLIAIIIVLAIIAGAIITRRCTECLLAGSLVGTIVLYGKDFAVEWCNLLQQVVADNAWLWLVCGLFGSLVALLTVSKGTMGFGKIIAKICNSQRKSLFATFIMGILIFIDDYLNVLSIGACMKRLYDERKLPRESLAYVLDSTGAPVCVLLPLSTWAVFYASLFYEQDAVSGAYADGITAYIHAIPFCFYPIITLCIVALFCAGIFPKIGAMKKAYQRVEETGMTYSEASRKFNHDEYEGQEQDGNIWNFLVPMIVLVGISAITQEILLGVLGALVVCLIMYVPRKLMTMEEFFNQMVSGFGGMLSIFFLLTGAFILKEVCAQMGMTEWLIDLAEPILTPAIFPAIAFLILGGVAFITGSDWGMSAVVIPIFIPLGAALGSPLLLVMAAIISGGTFGSHACFYADATVLSSQSSGIDNMEHAITQLPYVAISATLAFVAFGAAGFMMT